MGVTYHLSLHAMAPAKILHPDDYASYLAPSAYLTDERIHLKVRIIEMSVLDQYRLTQSPNTGIQAGNPGSALPNSGVYRDRPLDRVWLRGYEWIRNEERLAEITPRPAGPPEPDDPEEETMTAYDQETLRVGDPDIEKMSDQLLDALRITIAGLYDYEEARDTDIVEIAQGQRRVKYGEATRGRASKLFRLLVPYNVKPAHTYL